MDIITIGVGGSTTADPKALNLKALLCNVANDLLFPQVLTFLELCVCFPLDHPLEKHYLINLCDDITHSYFFKISDLSYLSLGKQRTVKVLSLISSFLPQ